MAYRCDDVTRSNDLAENRGQLVHVAIDLDTAAMRLVERRLGEAGLETAFLRQPNELNEHLPEVRFLLLGRAPRLDWSKATSLELIQGSESGIDPLFPAEGLDVRVQIARGGAHAESAREHVLALLLSFARDLPRVQRQQQARTFRRFPLRPLAGQRLVVVGLGEVGRRVAEATTALGMDVVGVRARPTPTPGVHAVFGPAALAEALNDANYVVVALPLTSRTRNLFDQETLESLPFQTVLVNVSRSGVLDEAALERLLREGRLKGAAIDVPANPPLAETSSLWSCPNLIISPELASSVPNFLDPILDRFVENVRRVARGVPPEYAVSREMEY
jgi:glyoxylate/hydroxypyruvate reductase